jgi:hypothetical protein
MNNLHKIRVSVLVPLQALKIVVKIILTIILFVYIKVMEIFKKSTVFKIILNATKEIDNQSIMLKVDFLNQKSMNIKIQLLSQVLINHSLLLLKKILITYLLHLIILSLIPTHHYSRKRRKRN